MNPLSFVFLAAVLLSVASGCTPCQQKCARVKEQLVRDFGVPAAQVDCTADKWIKADTCEKCRAIFSNDYGVLPTDSCSADGGF